MTATSSGTCCRTRRAARKFRAVQMVFQDPFGSLNPAPHRGQRARRRRCASTSSRPKADIAARVRELLEQVHLPADAAERYPHEFSGGQRQRIGIARALAARAADADRATSRSRRSTSRCRRRSSTCSSSCRNGSALTLVFITHDLRLVRHLTDRVAVMYLGRVVEVAETQALFAAPAPPLHAGPARRGADHRGGEAPERPRHHRRTAEPARPAARLRLPSPLPGRGRALPDRAPEPRCAAWRRARRAPRGVPSRAPIGRPPIGRPPIGRRKP